MKVLFFPTLIGSPFFETELELMMKHIEKDDEVFILRCSRQLKTCLKNPSHRSVVCDGCRSMFKRGISLLPDNKYKIIDLPTDVNIYERKFFDSVGDLMRYRENGTEIGLAVTSSLVHRFLDYKFDTKKFSQEINDEIQTAVYVYDFFKKIISELKPELIYFFNGRFSVTRPIIEACEEMGIKYITHERGGSMGKYSLFINSTPHNLEKAKREIEEVWKGGNNNKFELGKRWFEDRRLKIEQAWVSFIQDQKDGLLPQGFDKTKKNIAIYNSSIEEYFSFPNWNNPIYKDENDGLRKILESFKNEKNIKFYLRMHPNLANNKNNSQIKEIKEIAESYKNVIEIIMPDSPVSSYDLLDNCDCVLTFGSTMATEACYWGKPSILAGHSVFESLDCSYRPSNHIELVNLIKSDLTPKDKVHAIKYGFWEKMRGIPYTHFEHYDLHKCSYKGKRVSPNLFYRIIFFLVQLSKIKRYADLRMVFRDF